MKYLFLLCSLLFTVASFAQNAPITFEAGEPGANWTWTVFENETNPPLEIIPNPDASGINTSATVAKFTALQAGAPFAGCESLHGADLGPFVIGPNTSTVKIMVWKSVISDVGIKFAAPTGWAEPEIKVANTLINQWEEITFDFSNRNNPPASEGALDQIIIFPDFGDRSQDNIIYFDNITFSEGGGGGVTEPMTAAPTPTRPAANVISLFSDAYTDVPVDTWRTDWSSAALTDLEIQGNPTKRYSALDFVGIETVANQIDVTEMTHIHLDVWSADFTQFSVKLVDFGADGVFGGGDDSEHQIDLPNPAQGQWVGLDLPLADFTGLTNRTNMAQYILVGQPTGATTVFVDNVYFYTGGGGNPTEPMTAAPTPTRDPARVISLFSDAYTDVAVDTWRTDWSSATLTDLEIQGNPTKRYSALDFVGIETVANQIDATDMTHIHLDVWSADFILFGVKLVDFGADGVFGGGDDTEHQIDLPNLAQGQWVGLDLPLADFTGLTNRANMAQYILVGRPVGANTVFVDNVYFYNEASNTANPAALQAAVEIFPNPVQLGQNIRLDVQAAEVEVFDINGKLLQRLRNTDSLPATVLNQQGVYLVKVRLADGRTATKKLVVQ